MLSSLTPQQFRVIVVLLVILALVLAALIGVQLFGSGDNDDGAAPGTTQTVTTTAPATTSGPTTELPTTGAPSTTVAETTTSSTTTSVTTTSTTSSTTTTSTSSTTTTTLPPAPPLVLEPDGLEAVGFGAGVTEAIAIVTAALGSEPDTDTGWLDPFDNPYGTCPPPEIRGVEWGWLVLLFTSAETDFAAAGERHFFSYTYAPQPGKPAAGPSDLQTSEGIRLGSTVTDLESAYGSRLEIDPDFLFWAVDLDFETDTGLGGFLTAADPSGEVISVLGGSGCGE